MQEVTTEQPVRLYARLDSEPSRWLWLVKWLLAIPHYVVLYVLWVVFAVITVIAFFAILITGRYPRSLFDLNVGILRWSWRVGYYTYAVLGTDRYPPFSLQPRPDYPADLTVRYPERLSRGLVLVKWWLLAIPHYLVLGVLLGTSYYYYRSSDSGWAVPASGIGLAGLLVLFVGISLLFTRHYPRGMFNLLVGIERWAYRVGVYVALMSDRYPPFRLDQGPDDPAPPVPSAVVTPDQDLRDE